MPRLLTAHSWYFHLIKNSRQCAEVRTFYLLDKTKYKKRKLMHYKSQRYELITKAFKIKHKLVNVNDGRNLK